VRFQHVSIGLYTETVELVQPVLQLNERKKGKKRKGKK